MKTLIILAAATTITGVAAVLQSFPATVVRVVDGDTIEASVAGWPPIFNPIEVRLDGIDTPESRIIDAKCTKELKLGLIAKVWMKEKLPPGTHINLVWSGHREKYGRFLGTVKLDAENINSTLLSKGFARPYNGGKKPNWCL